MHRSRFARYLCLAVDAKGYGARDNVAQYDLQRDLPRVLRDAAEAAGLDREHWHIQPQGDGERALLPPGQPEPLVVDDFVRELDAGLALLNYEKRPEARLRLRVAIHFGVAYEAPSGFAGDGIVVTARLLDSVALHQALDAASDADVAVALSDRVYSDTVLQRHTSLRPDQFVRVEVKEKEYAGPAWIRVLSRGVPESPTGQQAAGQAGHVGQARQAGQAARPGRSAAHSQRSGAAAPRVQNNFFHEVRDTGVIGISITEQDGRR